MQNRVQTGVALVSLVLCNVQCFLHALDSGEEAEDAGGDQENTEQHEQSFFHALFTPFVFPVPFMISLRGDLFTLKI